jgi:hypothetical protein
MDNQKIELTPDERGAITEIIKWVLELPIEQRVKKVNGYWVQKTPEELFDMYWIHIGGTIE